MTSALVLRLPNFNRTFYLETDASDFGVAAILLQDNHPLALFSKKLGPRRRVTSTYHKELYAIVEVVQKWRQYLLSREFVIRSDQKSLKELLQQVIQTPDHQQLYARKLMGYKFRIEYKTGASNRVADVLSHRDMEVSAQTRSATPLTVDAPVCTGLPGAIAVDSGIDSVLLVAVSQPFPDVLDRIREETGSLQELLDLPIAIEARTADRPFTFTNGLIYFQNWIFVGSCSEVRSTLFYEHHNTPSASHPGVDRTFRRLAGAFYWKGMRKEVKAFVESCWECQTTKYLHRNQQVCYNPSQFPSVGECVDGLHHRSSADAGFYGYYGRRGSSVKVLLLRSSPDEF